MLADQRARALGSNFAGQWLYLRNLKSLRPDEDVFPDFDDNLRQALQRETEMLFESVVLEDHSVLDLLTRTTRSSTSGWRATTASRTSTAISSAASRSATTTAAGCSATAAS